VPDGFAGLRPHSLGREVRFRRLVARRPQLPALVAVREVLPVGVARTKVVRQTERPRIARKPMQDHPRNLASGTTHDAHAPNLLEMSRISDLALKQRRQGLVRLLPPAGEILRGTLRERFVTCGNPSCRCARGERHGPVPYLTVTLGPIRASKGKGKIHLSE